MSALRSWRKRKVSFGLVNFEVALKPLNGGDDEAVSGNRVDASTMTKVKQAWVNDNGDLVETVITAYPTDSGYVQVDETKLKVQGTDTIDLTSVVDAGAIDPIYYEKAYIVWPTKGSETAFDLLVNALREAGKVAIGKVVLGKNTRLMVLRWSEATETLVAHTCYYEANIRYADIGLVKADASARPAPDAQHLAMAATLLDTLSGDFDTSAVTDEYQLALRQAVEAAASGMEPATVTTTESAPQLDDLLAQLQASVA